MRRNEITFLIFSLLLAAIVGGLLGDLIGYYLPEGAAKTLFQRNLEVGIDSTTVDFFSISFTIGFMFRINFVSVLFLVMVLIYFRWWYI
jgi:ABC-type microcin C transport system permease subunit YejE